MTSNQFAMIRRVAGLTRQQFADKTGVSPQLVNAIERGERLVTARTAALVRSAFGLDADKLAQIIAVQNYFK
ncbi:helix-turn-helix transcriptional regulator [Sporosarcina sp. SAFN-010]|uniref:helix-turn-helix transcriptional regulator n=1 Tax=Sporosarcina sp. SAFN-010 TaxID=3387273 RepID=UPI003F822B7F